MNYVHGYDAPETVRLQDQASTLVEFLHDDLRFEPGVRVLEAGCGVGAQTVILAERNPATLFTAVDVSAVSVERASAAVRGHGFHSVTVQQADIFALPFALQARARGNALIGRELYPLLDAAGFNEIRVLPRMVYVDGSKPALIDGFTRKTFTAMIQGIREPALAAGITNEVDFDRGVADLYRTAAADGVFCYTFFKATAVRT